MRDLEMRPFLKQLYFQRVCATSLEFEDQALPNFLVGIALLDDDPGVGTLRRRIRQRLRRKHYTTPLAIGPASLLSPLEGSLANWCTRQLGFRALDPTADDYVEVWNGWVGSEMEVYRAAAGLVDAFRAEERICIPVPRS